ncbi:MAG TPA: hypothetical protein VLQ78_03360 [Ornithinibacter sp.]|nr:hypothetical protein [Ornithinibacter sp.]
MEPDPALAAVKTYNYLRIALAALVLLLFVSVALEWAAADRCLQPSISAYYFTPVRAVFVGVLVTMGVCLVALKGNTDGEDGLMNLAGMLAPGVAFVPTAASGRCGSSPTGVGVPEGVANNMPALFVTGVVVGVAAVILARREAGGVRLSTPNRLGLGLTVVVLGSGVVWFVRARDSFLERGHDAAAIPMFLAIIAVVWLNARDVQQGMRQGTVPSGRSRYVAVYRTIALTMLAALAATVAISLATGSTSVVLWVEVVLITLFAVFWLVQTAELWNRGLRGP